MPGLPRSACCAAEFVVLTVPAGEYTLEAPLVLNRSRTVLRGQGSGSTTLSIPKSECAPVACLRSCRMLGSTGGEMREAGGRDPLRRWRCPAP